MKSVSRSFYIELGECIGGLYRVEVWEGGGCVYRFSSCVLLCVRGVECERGGLEMLVGGVRRGFGVYFDSYNRSIYDLRVERMQV